MNKYKATIILFAATMGFLLTYPFHMSFVGGLLSSGFTAAMIGGVADWFGVTALFRKPLGVPFRTEIIPRNREKIFNALSNMVGDELLSKENLKQMIHNFDISKLLLKYIKDENKKEDAKEAAAKIVQDVLRNINSEESGRFIEGVIKENISRVDLASLAASAVELSVKSGYEDKLVGFVVDEAIRLSAAGEVREIITVIVQETMRSYEKDSTKRKLTNSILFDMMLQKSPSDIAVAVQSRLGGYLENLKNPDHELRIQLREWINKKIEDLRNDMELRDKVEKFKEEQLGARIELYPAIAGMIEKVKTSALEDTSKQGNLMDMFNNQIEAIIKEFQDNGHWQQELDAQGERVLMQFVESNHGELSIMVRENLNKLSEDMLVELIESKAGNDLQMIRINGSVVGGLVGMLIFLLNTCIGL